MKRFAFTLLLLVALSACRENVSKPYRGRFEDLTARVVLDMTKTKVTLTLADGKALSAKTNDLNYKNVFKGESAVFIGKKSKDDDISQAFLVQLDPTTRKEEGGLVHYRGEIAYFEIDSRLEVPTNSLQVVYSPDGLVMLDPASQRYEIGWGAGQQEFVLMRVETPEKSRKSRP